MKTRLIAVALIALAPCVALADKLGDHPAVVAQRMQAAQGYDYASKFYPHPAWMYLAAEAPRPMSDHPAVIVARRAQQEREARARAGSDSALALAR